MQKNNIQNYDFESLSSWLFVNPPLNFNAIKPNETTYQRVNNRITITIVNAKETSIPCIVKKLVKVPSTTPTPIGRNDRIPNIIEVV